MRDTAKWLMVGASSLVIVPVQVMAEEPPSQVATTARGTEASSGDIVVTARQRAEPLNRIPIAATALSTGDLVRNNATNITKIAELVPQVSLVRSPSGNGGSFTVRGIGSGPQDAGIEQSVSLALDGVQISRGRAVTANMFDLRQVEVLKGPQALFFGKNAPAGVVSISTALPTDRFSGFITSAYEFDAGERSVEGAVSVPLTSTLKVRLSGRYDKLDGWIKNTAQPAATNPFNPFPIVGAAEGTNPGEEDIAGRLTAVWQPTSNLTFTARGSLGHGTGNGEGSNRESFCTRPGGQLVTHIGAVTATDPQSDCRLNGRFASSDLNPILATGVPGLNGGRQHNEYDIRLASLTVEYRMGPVNISSISAYTYLDSTGSYNCGDDSFAMCFAFSGERYKAFSQQVRATTDFDSPLNYTIGFYYDRVRRRQDNASFNSYAGPDPVTGLYVNSISYASNQQHSISGFGQVRWNILTNVELAGGVRYTKEYKRAELADTFVRYDNVSARPVAAGPLTPRFSDDNFSPEATLTWHPTSHTTLYGAYKTGFLAGGISNPGTLSKVYTEDTVKFRSATVHGGEIGAKGQFFNRRLNADLTIYRYTFKDLPVSQINTQIVPPTYIVTNAAVARSQGIEGSMTFQATPDFQLRAAFGANRAKYLNYTGANCYVGQTAALGCAGTPPTQTLTGKDLYNAPRFTGSFGATYVLRLGNDAEFEFTGDGIYTSRYFSNPNDNPISVQDAFWRVNASITLRRPEAGWSLALVGRNLTNREYMVYGVDRTFGVAGEGSAVVARPREISLQLRYDF
jgi:iron complex outermembrane recepter protein